MSCLIGFIENGEACIASDSVRVQGSYQYVGRDEDTLNVCRMPHGILCGMSGYQDQKPYLWSNQVRNLLERAPQGRIDKTWLVRNLVPEWIRCLREAGMIPQTGEHGRPVTPKMDAALLLAQEDRLYLVEEDFTVTTIPHFCTIGDPAELVWPRILQAGHHIREALPDAFRDARTYCTAVMGPYYLYRTSDDRAERIGG